MDKLSRGMGYAMAIPTQAIAMFVAAWYGGEWLNANHPMDFNWFAVTFLFAFVSTGHTVYMIVRKELRSEQKEKESK